MDTLDYTGPQVNRGSKGVWMGLGDPVRELPRAFAPPVPPPSDVTDVRVFCAGCLVVGARPFAEDRDAASRLAAHPAFAGWPLLVVTDEPDRAARSTVNFLWTTFTRFEPAADIHAARVSVERNHVVFTPPVAIDARIKPWYPAEVSGAPTSPGWSRGAGASTFPTDGSRWAMPSAAISIERPVGCRTGGEARTIAGTVVSDTVTRGIRVQVKSVFVPERSAPREQHYFFAYHVRISNEGDETAQLLSRHWIVTNADGDVQEMRGPGVVGETPILEPGGSFEYTSYCPLSTAVGAMHGSYTMTTADGVTFDAEIAPFTLAMPNALN